MHTAKTLAIALLVATCQSTTVLAQGRVRSRDAPPVRIPKDVLERCAKRVTSECLFDVAWKLAEGESQGVRLKDIAQNFAKAQQWDRAQATVRRIPDGDSFKKHAHVRVEAERIARTVSQGSDAALRSVSDPDILFWAASRIFGYRERRGARLSKGFGNSKTLEAPSRFGRALLMRWEQLIPEASSLQHERLAESWLLTGEVDRAKAVLLRTQWKKDAVLRSAVELLLDVDEPARALDLIESGQAKYQGFYRTFVARWQLQRGNGEAAAAIALRAAHDVTGVREFRYLPEALGIVRAAGRSDRAGDAARAAEVAARQPDPFRPFNLSYVGEAYGRAGNFKDCLRLQAEGVGSKPKDNEVVGTGLISGPVTYGGIWNLGGELTNRVAAARILCGEQTALRSLDNRVFSQWYCDLRRHNAANPANLKTHERPSKEAYAVLLERAAECHLELGEREIGEALLRELTELAVASNDFPMLRSAAELAHVFVGEARRNETLRLAANALLNGIAKQKLRATQAAEFAYIWDAWGPESKK